MFFTVLQKRHLSSIKKYISFSDLNQDEIINIFYTVETLKNTNNLCKKVYNKTIILLLNEPCIKIQTSVQNGAKLLNLSCITIVHKDWDNGYLNNEDLARTISCMCDIIFCRTNTHTKMKQFAKYCTKPVVNVGTCRLMFIQSLADLFTIKQHFGNLNNLKIAWIGKPCPSLNTYLHIVPTLGMKLSYFCQHYNDSVSPMEIFPVKKKVQECNSLIETLQSAHIIVTNNHEEGKCKITKTLVEKYAEKNWIFLHCLPRKTENVDNELFNCEKNLIWESCKNFKYICAAIIKQMLK